MTDIKQIVSEIQDLPTLPQVVTEIMGTVNDPNSSAADIQRIIETDVALAAKVLKLINSSFYGMPNRISNVKQAIVILGFSTIKSLALSASILDMFSGSSSEEFDKEQFWYHCSACAMGAKQICVKFKVPDLSAENAFAAALIHDIGIIVMDLYAPMDFTEALEFSLDEKIDFYQAESEMLDYNHAQVGAELARYWKMPEDLIVAVENHHRHDVYEAATPLSRTVELADYICNLKEIGSSSGFSKPQFYPNILEDLNISASMEEIIEECSPEMEKADMLFKA